MSFIADILLTLYGVYNIIFQPLLALGPYWAMAIFSVILAFTFSMFYKMLLDVERQQEIKDKINEYQEKMKEAREDDDSEEASEHMKKTLELNQKMMMLNFKPMLATMFFVALIFPWFGATFSPAVELTEQEDNIYTGEFVYGGESVDVTVENSSETTLTIGEEEMTMGDSFRMHGIDWNTARFGDNGGWFSTAEGTILRLQAEFIPLPFSLPIAGNVLNWLGFYIIMAMPLTFIFRKLLGVS